MALLTTDEILDAVTKRIHDNTPEMRSRMITWLNDIIQETWLARDWKFLKTTSNGTAIASDKLALPTGYGRLLSVSVAKQWFIDQRNQFTDEEAFTYDVSSADGGYPVGWTEDGSFIYFEPNATGTPTLIYIPIIDTYDDNETTVFPSRFRALFVRTLSSAYYEFEADERGMVSLQLDQQELDKLHKWENKNDPQTQNTRYLRDRTSARNFDGITVL